MNPTERKPRRSFRPTAQKRQLLRQRLRESGFDAPADERIPRRSDRASAPLSFSQQRLWFIEQLQPGNASYNLPLAVRLAGRLEPPLLERSLSEIVRRHEVLRTSFPAADGVPMQRIHDPAPVPLPRIDLTTLPEGDRERELRRLAAQEAARPFDLERGPLVRAALLSLEAGEHAVLLNLHHIVFDGWSQGVLLRELTALYPALASGHGSPLPDLVIQYADFAAWQRDYLRGQILEGQLAYWRRQLAAVPPVVDLPADRPRPAIFSPRGAFCPVTVPAELTAAVAAVARPIEATPFMTLLAVFATLLWRSTGQRDLVVGSPVANRGRSELESLIGFFVNTLALRVDLAPRGEPPREPSFRELLVRVKETALGAYAHQDLPFEKLVDEIQPDRDLSHTPLFQVMLVLQNAPASAAAGTDLGLRPLAFPTPVAKFDLTLELEHWSGGMSGNLGYRTDLFDRTTAIRLARRFLHLFAAAVADPDRALGDLPILAPAERQQMLAEWATAAASPPAAQGECLLHRLFEAQVDRTPEAEALVGSDQRLSYRELEQRANQLAHHLRALGIRPELRVGVCLERSPTLAVAMLAVLKAGGAYVPLDPTLPRDRLEFLIADAGVAVVISDRASVPALPASVAEVLLLDVAAEALASRSTARPRPAADGRNLAYVIYTSGTTGEPKGVMVTHEDLVRRTAALAAIYGLGARDRQLQFFAIGFDAVGVELYPMLATGGAVAFYSHPLAQAAAEVLEYARVHRLTKIDLPPAYWHQVVDAVDAGEVSMPATLRILTTGGESPSPEKLRTWAAHARPGQRYFNAYGPTETTILVTAESVPLPAGARTAGGRVPIGRPLPGVAVYLVDAHLRPVAIGVPGELVIGGPGVARGYLNQPRLSAERFVPDPLSGDPCAAAEAAGSRLYRTGDLARTLADGRIEYLGRNDRQVKVRGFRIELEEIEAVLLHHPTVAAAAVVVREEPSGERWLAAYVVPRTAAAEAAELRGFLGRQLPVYMVPAVIVGLDALPLAATGKVDLRALPEPDAASRGATRRALAPRTPEEEILAGIWAEVLGLERVGVDDDFFALGGDSILSIQIVARARRAGLELTPQQLFQHPTIAELAAAAAVGPMAVADQGPVTGTVALTPIQHWFFEQALPRPEHWNQSLLLGVDRRPEPAVLAAALERLLAHHDALRLRFRRRADGWRQEIGPPAPPPPLTTVDLTAVASAQRSAAITAAAAQTQTSLDLGRGPLMRAVCFELGEPPARLLLVIHHLAVDAVSWRLLLEDLATAYDALSRGREPVLPAKTTSYKAWAERLEHHATSEETTAELDGWLAAAGAVVPLPVDGERRVNLEASTAALSVELSSEQTRALLKEVPNAYRTRINDVLLAALARALARWTGREQVVIHLEGHGRAELDDDLDLTRTVGWFTAIYPLRLEVSAAAGPGELLKTVKEQLRAVPRQGIGHGLLRYLGRDEQLAALPQPEVSFNYLGQVDQGGAETSPWLPVPEASGPDRFPGGPCPHLLAIDGAVAGGRLRMRWNYGAGVYERATVEAVAGDFLTVLRELIDHCLSPQAGGYTPSDFPLARVDQALVDRLAAAGPIEDLYPLAPMQQGMLFHSLADPDSGVYLERTTCELAGDLDPAAFHRAWQHLVDLHPVLRTAFVWQEVAEPHQVVRPQLPVPWRELDWRDLARADEEQRLELLLEEEKRIGLELDRPPLLRVILIRLADERFRLVSVHHHALLDGWSLPLVFADLFRCYEAFRRGREPELEPRRPYRDYVAWLQGQSWEAAEAHWREILRGFRTPVALELGRPAADGAHYAWRDRLLEPAASRELEALVRRRQLTLSTVVQGAWAVLLSRLSGARDVVFGVTSSGRPPQLPEVESMLGLFINTLPLRARLRPDQALGPWLERLQEQMVASRQYEHVPLTQVRKWSEVAPGVELFETLFVFENYPVGEALGRRSAALEVRGFRALEQTNYPLTLVVGPGSRLAMRFAYQSRRFDAVTAVRLLGHLQVLLEAMAADREETIDALPILSPGERHQILVEWNHHAAVAVAEPLLHRLFEAQADRTPEAEALVCAGERLSYRQLEERANQLAFHLRALRVRPDRRVGICLERSPAIAVAMLAVLKAGGAYVPLDPSHPPERLATLIEDAGVEVLISTENLAASLPASGVRRVHLDADADKIAAWSTARPLPAARAENLAYTIYTSGTTGRPKGVMVSHQDIARRTAAVAELYGLGPRDRQLQFFALGFDALGEEIYPVLATGGAVVFYPHPLDRAAAEVLDYAREHRLTKVNLPPAYWHQVVDEMTARDRPVPETLRILTTGGESPSPDKLRRWIARGHPGQRYFNVYGPTEGTILVTAEAVPLGRGADRDGERIPIGRPLPEVGIYLVDPRLRPVATGVPGELVIGGVGVARGYLDRPRQTAERFIPDPFAGRGSRLYRTGDLARALPDGRLEFVGRTDRQLNIRGHRLEPEEIEAVLARYPGLREAAVVMREDPRRAGDRRLAAYVAPRALEAEVAELRSFVARQLPAAMVPSIFVALESLPLAATGKVDLGALPDPEASPARRPQVGPRTPREEILADIWAEVLGLARVGVHDNFFELGGDSILSIQIVSRAARKGLHFTPRQLFDHATIAELAAQAGEVEAVTAEQGLVTGQLPLTPIQHWFFELRLERPHHWNQALLLAARRRLDPSSLRRAIAAILTHHDALRLRFERAGDSWRQRVAGLDRAVPFVCVDLAALAEHHRRVALERAATQLQASLDLGRGPLLRVACFVLGDGEPDRLLFAIHHLAVDGVSWRILLDDLQTAYRQAEAGKAIELPPKTTSFKHWAERLVEHARSDALRAEQARWLAAVEAKAAPLPVDFPQGGNRATASATLGVALEAEATQALLAEVPKAYRTRIDEVLLTALVMACARWTGAQRLLVELEGHGREEFLDDVDLSRTVGWFTSVHPLWLELPDGGAGAALKAIKEQVRAVPNRGVGYGLLRYLGDQTLSQRLAALPRPEVSFNYLGQFDAVLPDSALLKPARESAGLAADREGQRRHLLEINAQISGGQLRLDWRYSRDLHRRDTIRALADRYLESLRDLIRHCCSAEAGGPTPSDFPLARLDQATLDALVGPGSDVDVEDIYPLSPLQQGMLLAILSAPASDLGCERLACTLDGDLDTAAFEQAFARVVARHPILRTSFAWEGLTEPLQRVHRSIVPAWHRDDWRALPASEREERWERLLREDRERGFDLSRAPLMRLSLIRTAEESYRFSWTFHHILLDGWSTPQVVRELFAHYQAIAAGSEADLPEPRPYRDYVAWLADQDLATAEAYWRRTLDGLSEPTLLTSSRVAAVSEEASSSGYAEDELGFSEAASETLRTLAQRHRLTLNAIFQAAWGLLLSRYAGADDVVFGITVSGRPAALSGIETMVGMFINTLPLRVRVASGAPVLGWLREIRDAQADLSRFEHTPLAEVRAWCGIPSTRPLFDSLLVFENYPVKGVLDQQRPGLAVRDVRTGLRANYPWTLVVDPGARLILRVSYARRWFAAPEPERILGQLRAWLESLARNPERRVGELSLLSAAQRHQLLVEWSAAARLGAGVEAPGVAAAGSARSVTILLPDAEPAPIGLPGELHFGPSAAPPAAGECSEASGHLARYTSRGEIELLGPLSEERRIAGYRCFPRWLAQQVREAPAVAEAWVDLHRQGEVIQPIAYLVGAPGEEPDLVALRERLRHRLPDPLVPAAFAILDALPRTADGRVDRAALPAAEARPVREGFVGARDDFELRLRILLESTFHIQPIGVRDNFFDLGGTSLLAIHLVAEIRRCFAVDLPLSIVFEAPTIEELAQALRRPEHRARHTPLVVIRPGSCEPPFFCFHPGGGTVLPYSGLARHLSSEQPFYAIQAQGLQEDAEPLATVEEMAAWHLALIRKAQPEGPYLLGGWSFGGLVAMEAAQQLHSAGERVALVAIIDQPPITPQAPQDQDESDLIRDVLPPGFPLSAAELRQLGSFERQLEYLVDLGHQRGVLPPGFDLGQARRIFEMLKLHFRAGRNYRPRPYPGRITLLRAEDQLEPFRDNPTLGWAEYALGGIDVHQVPGDHQSLMSEPHVAALAASLEECLNKARARSASR